MAVIFFITELATTVEGFQIPDDIIFEFVDPLENFRLKLLQNYHKYLDMSLTFAPMVISCHLNPNYRLALLCEEAITVARKTGVFAYPK